MPWFVCLDNFSGAGRCLKKLTVTKKQFIHKISSAHDLFTIRLSIFGHLMFSWLFHSNVNRNSWKKLLEIVWYSFFFLFNFNWYEYHTTRNKWSFSVIRRMFWTVIWLHCLWVNRNVETKQEFVLLATNNDYSSKTNSKQKLYLNFCLCHPLIQRVTWTEHTKRMKQSILQWPRLCSHFTTVKMQHDCCCL